MKKQTITFSLLFALSVGVINIIDFSVGGALFESFALSTEKIFVEMEFWRLISYPFFCGTAEGLFLFCVIFIFVSPKLEHFLGTRIYPLFLFLISFVVGAITTIIFNSKSVVVGGMEGVSFFIFTVFMILLVKDKHLKERQPALAVGICAVIFWGVFKYFIAEANGIESVLPSLVIASSGVIIGLLVYLQIYFLIQSRIKKAKMRMRPMKKTKTPNNEELSFAMFNNPHFKEMFASITSAKTSTVEEKYYNDEDRLNFILDKINESGKESITPEELSFLENYNRSD
jgi:membrane associated rhomboid family serine protease